MRKTNKAKEGRKFATIIMAAGKGTRMKDPNSVKVMYEINGKPMVHYVVDLAYELGSSRVLVVVGYQSEAVENYLCKFYRDVEFIVQEQQLGTGHAVVQVEKTLENFSGDVLILSGDVPMLTTKTIRQLIHHHDVTHAVATILTADFEEPSGYGRIVRNNEGSVIKIVEHRDASSGQLKVLEINCGIYVFDKEKLFGALKHIEPHNVQNEYYLTDVFEYFWRHEWKVSAFKTPNVDEIRGINTVAQLEEARSVFERRG